MGAAVKILYRPAMLLFDRREIEEAAEAWECTYEEATQRLFDDLLAGDLIDAEPPSAAVH